MEIYPTSLAYQKAVCADTPLKGWDRSRDELNIHALSLLRIAAVILYEALQVIARHVPSSRYPSNTQNLIAACREIIDDQRVFILTDEPNQENSRLLEATIEAAEAHVAQATNTCNNVCVLLPEEELGIVLHARDIGDAAIKRFRI